MYAVVRTGGKQYRVAAGDILEVERLDGNVGDVITLDDVLLVSNGDTVDIGQPTVDAASVNAKITGQYRGRKILVFRYRPKKRIRVRKGHRQWRTRLAIESISAFGDTHVAEAKPETEPEDESLLAEVMATADAMLEAPGEDESVAEASVEESVVDDEIVDEIVVEDEVIEAVAEVETVDVESDEAESISVESVDADAAADEETKE